MSNLQSFDINGNFGFVAEVDIVIPEDLHDELDDFPLAPEKKHITSIMSSYMKGLWTKNEEKRCYRGSEKLLLTHEEKNNYIVHFSLLQFYEKMGARIIKIHRAITFSQSAYFKE